MNTTTKNEIKFDEFSNYETPQNIELARETDLNLVEKNNFNYQKFFKKIVFNLSIFLGVFLTFGSSIVIYQIFIADFSGISSPIAYILLLGYFLVGFILTFFGVEKEKRRNWKLYLFVPVFSFLLGFLFTLAPQDWWGRLFGTGVMLCYPLALAVFYAAKEYFENIENKLK